MMGWMCTFDDGPSDAFMLGRGEGRSPRNCIDCTDFEYIGVVRNVMSGGQFLGSLFVDIPDTVALPYRVL